jgi:hypothetical protein
MDYTSSSGLVFNVPEYEQAADMPLAFQNFADSISVAGIESTLDVVVREINDTEEISLADADDWVNKLHVLHPNVPEDPNKLITLQFLCSVSDLEEGWNFSFICVEPDWRVTIKFAGGGSIMSTSDSLKPYFGVLVPPYKMCNVLVVPCFGNWCQDGAQTRLALVNVAGGYDGEVPTMSYEATDSILNNDFNISSRDGWETKNITRPEDLV